MCLLKQTDEHLSKLGAKIEEERERAAGEDKAESVEAADPTSSDETPLALEKKTYYTIAHSIKEEVKIQPEILVGGTLKEYQVCDLLRRLGNKQLNNSLYSCKDFSGWFRCIIIT